jgi:hypothetical protein
MAIFDGTLLIAEALMVVVDTVLVILNCMFPSSSESQGCYIRNYYSCFLRKFRNYHMVSNSRRHHIESRG